MPRKKGLKRKRYSAGFVATTRVSYQTIASGYMWLADRGINPETRSELIRELLEVVGRSAGDKYQLTEAEAVRTLVHAGYLDLADVEDRNHQTAVMLLADESQQFEVNPRTLLEAQRRLNSEQVAPRRDGELEAMKQGLGVKPEGEASDE